MKTEFNLDELLMMHVCCRDKAFHLRTRVEQLTQASESDEITEADRADYRLRAESYTKAIKEVDELSEKIWQYLTNYTEL